MLKPCSPPGRPQPSMRSSMSSGLSCGILARAADTSCTVRSSGRIEVSDPLKARPMGERAVATMTASGMAGSLLLRACADHGCGHAAVTLLTSSLNHGQPDYHPRVGRAGTVMLVSWDSVCSEHARGGRPGPPGTHDRARGPVRGGGDAGP